MRLKSCKRCGQPFETDKRDAYMCPSCSVATKRASVYRQRICMDCSASYMGYPKSKRCPECQQEVNRARDRRNHATGPARHIGDTDICKKCGKDYVICSGLQQYCPDCAPEAVKENIRSAKREYAQGWIEQNKEYKAEMRQYNKICVVCGKVFDSADPFVTCSPECAKKWKALKEQESLYRSGKRITLPGVKYNSGLPRSGIVGVTARRNGKWQAAWKGHYIGIFATPEEAAAAIENYKKMQEPDEDDLV